MPSKAPSSRLRRAFEGMVHQEEFDFTHRPNPGVLSADDIYRDADAALLKALAEDRRIERKPAAFGPRQLGEYFSMWANTLPDGGLIAVGMEDGGTMQGLSGLSQGQLNELEKTGMTFCPDARHDHKRIPVTNPNGDRDHILLIRVYYNEAKLVETNNHEAFKRLGDSKKKLTREECYELQHEKGQISLEQESVKTPYPDGFDVELIKLFANSIRNDLAVTDRTDEEILCLRHLGKISDGRFIPNVACLLVFGNDPNGEFPGCKIRFLRFDGEAEGTGDSFNAVKDETIEGNVPRQIIEAERLLDSQLRMFSRLGPDGKFYTASEYPKDAWFEAIVNACAHRSYGLRNMNIFVKMFDDRLVVESPGGFPPFVTPLNIYGTHHPRNTHLMGALQYLRFVKCVSEGTRRMRDTMRGQSLPHPEFKQEESGSTIVKVTLRNNIKQRRVWVDSDASRIIGEALSKSLTEDEHRAINFIAEHGSINVSQFQRLTQRNWPVSKKILLRLAKAGILRHVHKRGKGRDPAAQFILKGERPTKANGA
jgi:ATP-dependent DNA helicase RecG